MPEGSVTPVIRDGKNHSLPNGCWRCIGCGKIISPNLHWNQCADCDTRNPEDVR